jgi:hypothetical protein
MEGTTIHRRDFFEAQEILSAVPGTCSATRSASYSNPRSHRGAPHGSIERSNVDIQLAVAWHE